VRDVKVREGLLAFCAPAKTWYALTHINYQEGHDKGHDSVDVVPFSLTWIGVQDI
jgi:hypothetical protein